GDGPVDARHHRGRPGAATGTGTARQPLHAAAGRAAARDPGDPPGPGRGARKAAQRLEGDDAAAPTLEGNADDGAEGRPQGAAGLRGTRELSAGRAFSGMQGGPVDELLDVAVERAALDEFEVEVGGALEDRAEAGLTGDHREERHLDAVDQAG